MSKEHGKFLLLCGPSGVGKTSIIHALKNRDPRFVYIKPDTTRPLRENETDKNHVSLEVMQKNIAEDKYIIVNHLFNIYYATPKKHIDETIAMDNFCILDFPISKHHLLHDYLGDKLYTVYLTPPSLDILKQRLDQDGRDKDGSRYLAGSTELAEYHVHLYDHMIDLHVASSDGELDFITQHIYTHFLKHI